MKPYYSHAGIEIYHGDCREILPTLKRTSQDGALRIFTLNRVALMTDGAQHPTQKPLSLIKWCLGFTPEAQTVIDPFCGSGTTLVACKDTERTAVGIDLNEEYCEIAAKRLSQEVFSFE